MKSDFSVRSARIEHKPTLYLYTMPLKYTLLDSRAYEDVRRLVKITLYNDTFRFTLTMTHEEAVRKFRLPKFEVTDDCPHDISITYGGCTCITIGDKTVTFRIDTGDDFEVVYKLPLDQCLQTFKDLFRALFIVDLENEGDVSDEEEGESEDDVYKEANGLDMVTLKNGKKVYVNYMTQMVYLPGEGRMCHSFTWIGKHIRNPKTGRFCRVSSIKGREVIRCTLGKKQNPFVDLEWKN